MTIALNDSGLARALVLMLCVISSSCVQRPAELPPAVATGPAGAPTDFPAQQYRGSGVLTVLDSTLTIKVYRGGRLQRLGHNHVLTSDRVGGLVQRAKRAEFTGSYADLYVPVASLVIDDPAARAAAGADFASVPSAADRSGTRANLLGPKLLDAEQYPFLRAAIREVSATQALVELQVRDHRASRQLPITVTSAGDTIVIEAAFTATHAELGLTPFSVLGGAITVADPITIELVLTAAPRLTSSE